MPFLTPEIYEGSDGHLFLAKGSNDVLALLSQSQMDRLDLMQRWTDLLSTRSARLAVSGVQYFHCFVPDKLSIYREEAGELWVGLSSPAEDMESREEAHSRPSLVPLTAYLLKQKTRHLIFFRSDTHWTVEGCFSAYQMLCVYIGIEQREALIRSPTAIVELSGDLGGKLDPPRREMFRFASFGRDVTRIHANRIVELRESGGLKNHVNLHVGSVVCFSNPTAKVTRRVLIFGDSFSEYRTHLLTGLFASTVTEVMFVWSANIDFDIVKTYRPDVVITEIAERFMGRLPTDDIDLLAHAEKKVCQAFSASRK